MTGAPAAREPVSGAAPDPTSRTRHVLGAAGTALLVGGGILRAGEAPLAGKLVGISGVVLLGVAVFVAGRRSRGHDGPGRHWRIAPWFAAFLGAAWLAAQAFRGNLLPPGWIPALPAEAGRWVATVFSLAVWTAAGWGLWRATRGLRAGPARTPENVGLPHDVDLELVRNGARTPVRVVVGAEALTIESRDLRANVAKLDPPLPGRVALAGVRAVRPEGARVVVEVEAGGRREALALVPASFAERERLVWELALRRPDLFAA